MNIHLLHQINGIDTILSFLKIKRNEMNPWVYKKSFKTNSE